MSNRTIFRAVGLIRTSFPHHILDRTNLRLCLRRYCYDARKIDITGGKQTFMFDTQILTKSLLNSGFTDTQSDAIVSTLVQISQVKMDFMNKNMVTKAQQEILLQQIMSHLSAIKKDMIILEKSEFSSLRHEYDKQHIELQQLKRFCQDELLKLKADIQLDVNLERSRAKDSHSDSEKSVAQLQNQLHIMRSDHDKHISGLDNKIEKEIAKLLATYERYRNDVMKYAAGTVMTCLTICLGFYRLWA